MVRRKLQLINLRHQRVLDQRACLLSLTNETLNYVMDFTAEEPLNWDDPEMGIVENHKYYDVMVKRESITMVDMTLCDGRIWRVSLHGVGLPEELRFYFKHQYLAVELLEELKNYIINGIQHLDA